jgi:hypothetical protein
VPELLNPETPELNSEQKYSKFPFEVKLSLDCVFMAVTLANGEVKIIKMPPILSPLDPYIATPVETAAT